MERTPSIVESLDLLEARPQSELHSAGKIMRQNLLAALFEHNELFRLGRFEIQRLLGAGGMGSVFEGWDPELERKVAIKVLHRGSEERSRERLYHEAQSLARVRHPGVVTIHEVGREDGRLFLVMELMQGGTLREWMAGAHSVVDLCRLLEAPIAGLLAAHEAGLVHRDLKPENIVLDGGGRAKVSDFGLVIEEHHPTLPEFEFTSGSELMAQLGTERGPGFAGTPAYAAPEVLEGGGGSKRADIYSMCATIYEALYGQRVEGPLVELPPRRASARRGEVVPLELRKLVGAGLSLRPADRPGSSELAERMSSLAHPAPSRLRFGLKLTGASVAMAGVAALVYPRVDRARCELAASEVETRWQDDQRARLARALGEGQPQFVKDQLAHANELAARRVDEIVTLRNELCQAEHEAERPRLARCASRVEGQFEAWLSALEGANAEGREKALASFSVVLDPAACWFEPSVDPDTPEVRAVRGRLADARAQFALEKGDPAELLEIREQADALGAGGTAALAQYEYAARAPSIDRKLDGLALAYEALARATESGSPRLIARAWNAILRKRAAAGKPDVEFERAETMARAAAGQEGVGPSQRAAIARTRAEFHYWRYDFERAAELQREAVRLYESTGSYELELARAKMDLAQSLTRGGKPEDAITLAKEALAVTESFFPENHPRVAAHRSRVGMMLAAASRYEASLAYFDRARESLVAAFGPDSPSLIPTLQDGYPLYRLGRHDEAIEHTRWALRLEDARFTTVELHDFAHGKRVAFRIDLATFLRGRGDYDEALRVLGEAKELAHERENNAALLAAIHERTGSIYADRGEQEAAGKEHLKALEYNIELRGPKSIGVGIARNNLGNHMRRQGDPKAALPHYDDAEFIFVEKLGAKHSHLGHVYTGRAEAHLMLRDFEAARADIERALEIRTPLDPKDLWESRMVLAEIELADGRRRRARELLVKLREADVFEGKLPAEVQARFDALVEALG